MTLITSDRPHGSVEPAPDSAALSIQAAAKTYRALDGSPVEALRPVDLDVPADSFVALVGRSGCGKSTLLKLVAGLEPATSGQIRVGGEPVLGPPDRVRYVFQNYAESLLPWKTVGENVAFGLKHAYRAQPVRSRAERDALVEQYLAEVGLYGVADRYPSELSGGMQQRVAIARALAAQPEVLLLDEPFSAVDALSRATLQDLVLRIWQEHRLTVLFVTHDIDEALYLADRVVVLRAGGAGIERDVEVPLPRPRDQVATREHPDYLRQRRDILELVLGSDAIAASPDGKERA